MKACGEDAFGCDIGGVGLGALGGLDVEAGVVEGVGVANPEGGGNEGNGFHDGCFLGCRLVFDGVEDFAPAFEGWAQTAEGEGVLAGGFGHVVAHGGFVGHFACVVDEVLGAVAEPACLPVLDHLTPTAAVVDDEDAAAGHGLEADAGPVFRGVHGLEDDVAVFVEVLLGDDAVVGGKFDPGLGFADFLRASFSEAEEEAGFGFGGDEVLVSVQGEAGVFFRVLP